MNAKNTMSTFDRENTKFYKIFRENLLDIIIKNFEDFKCEEP